MSKYIELSRHPLCSVCIANYNGEQFLGDCIDSVMTQDFDHPIEIIVHDDASQDGSVDLIKSKFPHVRLLTSNENVGFCISNNRMVDAARGQFILLLNNDARLHPDALKSLYTASLVYGAGIFGLPQYNAQTNELIDIGSLFDPFLNPIPNLNACRQDVGMIIGACLWLPRKLWHQMGGFPDWFGSMAEDMYLCCLARLKGIQVKAIAQSGFDHWVGRSFGGGKVLTNQKLATTRVRRAISERNKSFVMMICYPSPLVWLFLPISLLLLCVEGITLSLIKRDAILWQKVYWNCLKELWRRRHALKRKRHLVQITRQCSLKRFFQPFQWMPHKLRMLIRHGLPEIK